MNKTELARKIQTIAGLDSDERTMLLELLRQDKKYGLVWERMTEDVVENMRDVLPLPIERNDEKIHPIISSDPNAPTHIIIEGDNLAALVELTYTHSGRFDLIYIDPPYNTGNNDFSYYDDFSDEYRKTPYVEREDSYRHSKWISFMHRRLSIAKSLLSKDGFIFISIDDNEQANLKLLCDEVFDEQNFRSNSIVINNRGGRDYGGIALQHDYILVYSRSDGELNLIDDPEKKFRYEDEEGGFNLMELRNRNVKFNIGNRPNLCYPFYVNPANPDSNGLLEISLEPKEGFVEVYPAKSGGIQTVWRWGKEEKARPNLNVQIFGKANRNGGYMIVQKYRKTSKMQRSVWDEKEFVNERGSEVLKEILTQSIFSYPKSVATIMRVLELATSPDSYVLDFFAGSGTTMHAVMELNRRDKGRRTCVLCTNNENGICEDVTYARNKKVIEGYTTPAGKIVAGLGSNNLRYYRTEFFSRDRTAGDMRILMRAATGLLCIRNNNYTEAPFGGRRLNPRIARYFETAASRMLVIYDERAVPGIAGIIANMADGPRIKVYVFSHGVYAYEDEFADVAGKVELCALPQAIYDAYRSHLPRRRLKLLPEEIIDELVEEIEEQDEIQDERI